MQCRQQVLWAYCPNIYVVLSGISTQWQVVTAGAAQNMTTHPQLWFGTYDQNKRVYRCSQLLTEFQKNCLWNSKNVATYLSANEILFRNFEKFLSWKGRRPQNCSRIPMNMRWILLRLWATKQLILPNDSFIQDHMFRTSLVVRTNWHVQMPLWLRPPLKPLPLPPLYLVTT